MRFRSSNWRPRNVDSIIIRQARLNTDDGTTFRFYGPSLSRETINFPPRVSVLYETKRRCKGEEIFEAREFNPSSDVGHHKTEHEGYCKNLGMSKGYHGRIRIFYMLKNQETKIAEKQDTPRRDILSPTTLRAHNGGGQRCVIHGDSTFLTSNASGTP